MVKQVPKYLPFQPYKKNVSLMKLNLKTADLLVYLSYLALLTCERKLTTYAACYCIISHAPVGSKCKKNISTCCCPDKICEFLPAAGRCNRHTESVPSTGSGLGRVTPKWKGQGAGSPGMYPSQVQIRQSLPG